MTGATVPPMVRSPMLTVVVGGRCRNFAHVSRTVTKNSLFVGSYDGDMKFVDPYQSGHVSVPSGVGSWPGIRIGRLSFPSCVDHVVFANGLPSSTSPVARSST